MEDYDRRNGSDARLRDRVDSGRACVMFSFLPDLFKQLGIGLARPRDGFVADSDKLPLMSHEHGNFRSLRIASADGIKGNSIILAFYRSVLMHDAHNIIHRPTVQPDPVPETAVIRQ